MERIFFNLNFFSVHWLWRNKAGIRLEPAVGLFYNIEIAFFIFLLIYLSSGFCKNLLQVVADNS